MKTEHQPGTIEQWYDRAMALDQNWRKNRREEERLRRQREQGGAETGNAMTISVAEKANACSDGVERTNTVMI